MGNDKPDYYAPRNDAVVSNYSPPANMQNLEEGGNETCSAGKPKRRKKNKYEYVAMAWFILILSGLMQFGDYYAFDMPYALKSDLKDRFLKKYTNDQFQAFYSSWFTGYEIPNLFLPLCAGLIIDKFGCIKVMLIVSILIMAGNGLVYLGVQTIDAWMLGLGRLIYGLGGDNLVTVQWVLIAQYFKPHQMGAIYGFTNTITNIATAMNFWASPIICEKVGINAAFIVSFILCCLSLISAVATTIVEKVVSGRVKKNAKIEASESLIEPIIVKEVDTVIPEGLHGLINPRDSALVPSTVDNSPVPSGLTSPSLSPLDATLSEQAFNEPWWRLPGQFWVVFCYQFGVASAQWAFYFLGQDMINQLWFGGKNEDLSEDLNNQAQVAMQITIVVFGLVFGWMMAKWNVLRTIGYISIFGVVASFGLIYVASRPWAVLSFVDLSQPWIPFSLAQVFFSGCLAYVWVKETMVVPEEKLGVATGLLIVNNNIAVAALPWITTWLVGVIGSPYYTLLACSAPCLFGLLLNGRFRRLEGTTTASVIH